MRTPLQRIRIGGVLLAMIVAVAIVGFALLGYSWIDAMWIVAITISGVGYGETSNATIQVKLLMISVIVFGMSAAIYTIGGFLQLITEGEIERLLGTRRMTKEIGRLNDHVIICGYGRMGQLLAQTFKSRKRPFVVIENDQDRVDEARTAEVPCISGDATDEGVLEQARIGQAKSLVTALPTDADNVFITLTARNLCDKLQIVARAEHESTAKKLRQAGADKVVMPAIIGAQQMVRLITRPTTADLMELVAESTNLDVELDEIELPPDGALTGVTVRETEAHRRHRLLVLAVKQPDGTMVFSPDADYVFKPGDIVIIMGGVDDMATFRREYKV